MAFQSALHPVPIALANHRHGRPDSIIIAASGKTFVFQSVCSLGKFRNLNIECLGDLVEIPTFGIADHNHLALRDVG
jgi:hypothetical protein